MCTQSTPLITKSQFAWAKAMHTCRGRHKDIKICDRMNLSDNFSFGPPACFLFFQSHFGFDVPVEQTMWWENDGNYFGADL